MFTAKQRAGYLGASDMPFVMNSNKTPEQLLAWWECKVGIREQDPPTWAMKLGSAVGDMIIDEYELQSHDLIGRRQEVVCSPVNARLRSTLDGFSADRRAVIEAKFASPFMDRDAIFATYYAQVAMQMHCTDADRGYLVVAQGTNDPFEIECIRDKNYEEELLERAAVMLICMDRLIPPVNIKAPSVVPPEKWRTVDLSISDALDDLLTPNWARELLEALTIYHETKDAADDNKVAGLRVKALIPDDVGRVIGPTHAIARNKNGTLTITRKR